MHAYNQRLRSKGNATKCIKPSLVSYTAFSEAGSKIDNRYDSNKCVSHET